MGTLDRNAGLPQWLRVVVAASSLPLFGLGLGAMFVPDRMLDLLDLTPRGIYGYNTIRSDIGGLLIASGLLIIVGLLRRNTTWFLAAAVVMGVLLLGRAVSFAADGVTPAAVPAIVVEVVVTAVMLIAHRFATMTAAGVPPLNKD